MATFRLGFSADAKELPIVDILVGVCFIIDIILTFHTADWSKVEKMLITSRKKIAKTYLSTWFFFDFLSVVSRRLFFLYIFKMSGYLKIPHSGTRTGSDFLCIHNTKFSGNHFQAYLSLMIYHLSVCCNDSFPLRF